MLKEQVKATFTHESLKDRIDHSRSHSQGLGKIMASWGQNLGEAEANFFFFSLVFWLFQEFRGLWYYYISVEWIQVLPIVQS